MVNPLPVFQRQLAPYASTAATTRGRLFNEKDDHLRTAYQRDRARVIHSAAFRKLKGKTQVFIDGEGDYYRTRLTHSLEVAQIAHDLARSLGVDEDLAEVIALAHDIGHTPFGHTGEDALAEVMPADEKFDHNEQSLRNLMIWERRYPDYDGLNLTWETLEGLVKHNGPVSPAKLRPTVKQLDAKLNFMLEQQAGLEAQIAGLADDIAYAAHDIEDGYRTGLLSYEQIRTWPFVAEALHATEAELGLQIDDKRRVSYAVRSIIGYWLHVLFNHVAADLAQLHLQSPDEVRRLGRDVCAFPPAVMAEIKALKKQLRENFYSHAHIAAQRVGAIKIVQDLYGLYMADLRLLPPEYQQAIAGRWASPARTVADYIAGMTDRYAIEQHEKLTGKTVLVYGKGRVG